MSLRSKESLFAATTVAFLTISTALAQSGSETDVTKPAGATRAAEHENDEQLRAAERRIAELEARLKELEAAVAKGDADHAPSKIAEFADTVAEGETTPPAAANPAPEPVDPTASPTAMLAELERRYLDRFGASSGTGRVSAEELDTLAGEVSRWAMRQNSLLGQPVAWTVRVVRVEPSRQSAQRAVLVCRGLAPDQREEVSDDFRVELDADARELLRQHGPDAAFVIHGRFDPRVSFSPEHQFAGPWHRKGHFVGPYCVSNWTVIGDSIEAAAARESAEIAPIEPAPAEIAPTPSDPTPAEADPAPLQMPEDSDSAAAHDAAGANEAARVAAEQEAERLAAEQETARVAAEQEAARLAAEQETARVAAEQEAARLATEQEAARLAAEQEAARVAAEQEAARLAAEEEAARVDAEEESARLAAEQEAARLATEQEAARLADEAERRAVVDAESARAAAEAAARTAAEADATRRAAEQETERLAAAASAVAEAEAAAKAESERRAKDPLWYLTPTSRKMVDRSAEQLARTTDAATVAQLVRGYESRLPSVKDDLRPAIEAMLTNAKKRLTELSPAAVDAPQ